MVLNHHLLGSLAEANPGESRYHPLTSQRFFDGIELPRFLGDYERYMEQQGSPDLSYRLLTIKSLPLEEALAGRVDGINPALLRIFLEMEHPGREPMLEEIAPLYQQPFGEIRGELRRILRSYLEPFFQERELIINQVPLFRYFERNGNRALLRLVRHGEDIEDVEPQ